MKSTTSIAIYVNGALQDSRPLPTSPTFLDTNSTNLRIGSYVLEGSHLKGSVDEADVFSRALSAAEIQAIYNADSDGKTKPSTKPIEIKTDQSEYWISDVPEMPTIKATAKVVGVSPDPTGSTSFTWTAEVQYKAAPCGPRANTPTVPLKWPGQQTTLGAAQYVSTFVNPIVGGDLTLTVTASVGGEMLTGRTTVKVLGKDNPTVPVVQKAFGDNYTVWRIASHESTSTSLWAQFNPNGNGYPKWGNGCDFGVGIMQLTTEPVTYEQMWNWVANVKSGEARLRDKRAEAMDYPRNVEKSQRAEVDPGIGPEGKRFKALVRAYNALRGQEDPPKPPLWIEVPPLKPGDFNCNLQQREIEAIRRYNGNREYQIGTMNGLLVVKKINENSLRGEAEWEPIPESAQPSKPGDRYYVRGVLDSSTGLLDLTGLPLCRGTIYQPIP